MLQRLKSSVGKALFGALDSYYQAAPATARPDRVALVRLDAIGDYVLFRNFLALLRHSQRFAKSRLLLIGNAHWKDLALQYDREWVDDFLWVDTHLFRYDLSYKFQILRQVRQFGAQTLINPTFTRSPFTSEEVVRLSGCPERIGRTGDTLLLSPAERARYDRFYTTQLPDIEDTVFEFERNRAFFAALVGTAAQATQLQLGTTSHEPTARPYAAICPGAQDDFRCWPPEHFAAICDFIATKWGWETVLLGGKQEQARAKRISNMVRHAQPTDQAGKLSLVESIQVLREARLAIVNDSAPFHLAATLHTPVLCISNGNHFGRFNPYPTAHPSPVWVLYPERVRQQLASAGPERVAQTYQSHSDVPIEAISPEEVIETLCQHFS